MDEITIWDILSLLRLGEPKYGSSSFNVACPCCDDGRDKHLNINVVKEVFRCPRCGVSGGKLKLYALFMNVPMSQVVSSIRDRMGIENAVDKPPRRPILIQKYQTVKEYPITDVDSRHATYSALLERLSLSKDHSTNDRGYFSFRKSLCTHKKLLYSNGRRGICCDLYLYGLFGANAF